MELIKIDMYIDLISECAYNIYKDNLLSLQLVSLSAASMANSWT